MLIEKNRKHNLFKYFYFVSIIILLASSILFALYTQAEQLHRRAITIYEKVLEPDHPVIATPLENLAVLYWAMRIGWNKQKYWNNTYLISGQLNDDLNMVQIVV